MVALTFGDTRVTSVEIATKTAVNTAPEATAAPRTSWLTRFFDAMMQARLQQAQREIRLHSRMIPEGTQIAPYVRGEANAEAPKAPLGGW